MSEEPKAKRDQALSRAIQQIEKSYGKGAIMHLDESQGAAISGIGTGALSLDLALGGRGVPRGRVIEVFGPESSGKTTLALSIIAQAQKGGGTTALIDAEHAFDPTWAKRIGVNLEALMVNQPSSGEEALDICEMLVRSNSVDVIAVDSVAALIPRAEIDGSMGDTHVGLQARLMSQAMRKLTAAISKSRSVVIFINQIREKIGVMFGNPETTPGGRALKFYSAVRIDVRRISTIKEGDQAVGIHIRARVVKNKVAAPYQNAEFDLMFASGISREGDLLDLAVSEGVAEKSGAWFNYGQVRLGQGRENVKQFLKDNPDLADEIEKAVLAKRGLTPDEPPVGQDDSAAAADPGADEGEKPEKKRKKK